jgi:signal transduction histidine kinase
MNMDEIRGATILIVDDTPENIGILFEYLSRLNVRVLVAQCGEDALKITKERIPDLVLMDILMPGMGGYETCRKIKNDPQTTDIPVIFVSALSHIEEKINSFEAGAVDYITKPFQQEEVLARITTHLGLRKLAKALEQKNRLLEQEVAERVRAEKKAEAASLAKSEFLAGMSHELRTPLNGILGYAQILKRDKTLNEFQKKGIEIIERSGSHLLNLINEILDLSQIEARKLELKTCPIPFAAFLETLSDIIRVQAKEKGLSFDMTADENLPHTIRADEKRLYQILLNILGNAVKYTLSGGLVFRILRLPDSPAEKDMIKLRFEVEDTGIGIPENKMDEIFSPFRQLGQFTRNREGVGLGLTISRHLVRMMGGELNVKSIPEKGSIFWFDLCVEQAQAGGGCNLFPVHPAVGYEGPVRKILVVDDNAENRSVLTHLLTPLGFEVLEAVNGKEGAEKAFLWKPDLVFMDLVMPVMNGFDASRLILAHPDTRHTQIIAVSASTTISPQQVQDECGCRDYIRKPIRMDEILDTIGRYLKIRWIYEKDRSDIFSPVPETVRSMPETDEIPVPEEGDLALLYELTCDGNFQQINAELDRIADSNVAYLPFIAKLREPARVLDEDSLCRYLLPYLRKSL